MVCHHSTKLMHALFTIGHSNHTFPELLELLRRHDVSIVCDVRSQPYSRRYPQFCQVPLKEALEAAGIRYEFLGRELGARPKEPDCYVDGQVAYDRLAQTPAFQAGLRTVRERARVERPALLCAEKDPITCHRTVLVCRRLREPGLAIRHILEDGDLEEHRDTELRLLALLALPQRNLFEETEAVVEHAYDLQGHRIARRIPDIAAAEANGCGY
jgi:uncharacterized protein (DUF488 family)